MAVNGVQSFRGMNSYHPQFKGSTPVKEVDKGDYIERHIKTEASTGKKWGVGIASFFLTGLGQFINGDVGKGLAFLTAGLATCVGTVAGFMKGNRGLYLGSVVAGLGASIWSIVDAVKNAKSETVQIVQKNEASNEE